MNNYDGLVVLTCVNQPPTPASENFGKEAYALALEQTLCHHFAFVRGDNRLENTLFSPGRISDGSDAGYVVYLAFKFADENASP